MLIPPSTPRTKPKACNIGLARARGEFVAVYDAADRPEQRQLRKAVLAFRALPGRVVCVQAELRLWRQLGTKQTLAFHLTMGLSTITTLANPFFRGLTLLYLCTGTRYVQVLFPPLSLYCGAAAMVIGNSLMIYCMMAGCLERGLFPAVRAMLTIPLYWALMSVAAYKALYQLARPDRRHFWELTEHGLVDGAPAVDDDDLQPALR
ncbi:hypothetical protein ACU635_23215 [[Actinomadura] parvosata]|uniref:hypothetical protein n=1 Tax=[Actinomadura] parvosata TaxID=1955412 RepID=UPI00406C38B3